MVQRGDFGSFRSSLWRTPSHLRRNATLQLRYETSKPRLTYAQCNYLLLFPLMPVLSITCAVLLRQAVRHRHAPGASIEDIRKCSIALLEHLEPICVESRSAHDGACTQYVRSTLFLLSLARRVLRSQTTKDTSVVKL